MRHRDGVLLAALDVYPLMAMQIGGTAGSASLWRSMPRPRQRAACAALRRLGGANSVSADSGQAGGFTRRPYTDGTVRSEELQALMMRRG